MIIRKNDDVYEIESSSEKGTFYTVEPDKPWCDCPTYKFRELRRKGLCKHIKAVREYLENIDESSNKQEKTDKIHQYIENEGGEAESIAMIDKFGEEIVNKLIKAGDIIENSGKIKILK
ncbi:SWIM zinc finger family protein [Candidatus Woesearchaeota archaeon]|nr:SWIM zinc finger family protein [Candidatus Woesearchaeota archaeon]